MATLWVVKVYKAIMDQTCRFDTGDKYLEMLLGKIHGKRIKWEKTLKLALTRIKSSDTSGYNWF
jgi:hypothetical protein